MQKAVIKECRHKGNFAELVLIVGSDTLRYQVKVTLEDASLLKPRTECEFEAQGKTLTKLLVGEKEIALNRIDQAKLSIPNMRANRIQNYRESE